MGRVVVLVVVLVVKTFINVSNPKGPNLVNVKQIFKVVPLVLSRDPTTEKVLNMKSVPM